MDASHCDNLKNIIEIIQHVYRIYYNIIPRIVYPGFI